LVSACFVASIHVPLRHRSIRATRLAGCGCRHRQRLRANSVFVKASLKQHPLPWRIALVSYLLGLALIGFWPTPVDKPIHGALASALKHLHRLGLPAWFDYRFVEASANVAMFIPFGVLLAMALPTKTWWGLASAGLLASICIELGQLLFMTARVSSLGDVVTNTLGAVMGVVGSRLIRRSIDPKLADA